jgi:hypothetical protein
MWEPQPLATLRASTACTGKTLPYFTLPAEDTHGVDQVQMSIHIKILKDLDVVRIVLIKLKKRGVGGNIWKETRVPKFLTTHKQCKYSRL